ncbi:MAG: ABC transporter permease [Microbacteriaceae bacterium]|nr:MAG: ABC transporter permease [Microbacteriaceae bacterium]
MNGFTASVRHELLCTRRARMPHLLLVVFVGMVAVSVFIGWSGRSTVSAVYHQITAQGLTSAPDPFKATSPLYYTHNAVIYVVLIGALLAILLGVQATIRDRKAATSVLVLSRPGGRAGRLLGQLTALSIVLAVAMAAGTVISWVGITVITGSALGPDATLRLAAFGVVSCVFLAGFALIGMLSGIYCKKETTALLAPVIAWSVITFVLPQLGTAARPVALLNPVPSVPPPHGGFFGVVNMFVGPISITEQFKTVAGVLLGNDSATGSPAEGVVILAAFLAILIALVLLTSRQRLRSPLNE